MNKLDKVKEILKNYNQEHLLNNFEKLDESTKENLIS